MLDCKLEDWLGLSSNKQGNFSKDVKDITFQLCFFVEEWLKEIEGEPERYTTFYPLSDDIKEFTAPLQEVVDNNKDLVRKNILFSSPPAFDDSGMVRLTVGFGDELDGIRDIFDDFINFTARCFLSFKLKKDKIAYFKTAWKQFEQDFFADQVEIRFNALVYCFWFDTHGKLEDIVPENNLCLRWISNEPDGIPLFYKMQQAQISKSGDLTEYKWPNENSPQILLEFTSMVDKSRRLEYAFREASENFDKVCLLLRLIAKGGVHYSCMAADFMGNRTNIHDLTSYKPLNQLLTPLDNTHLTMFQDKQFRDTWPSLKIRDIKEFDFQIQKFRDYAQVLASKQNPRYGRDYERTLHLEKIIDLVQIIEATLGDKVANPAYINQMLGKGLEERLRNLVALRNKYIHGAPDEINTILATEYSNNFGKLETDITMFLFVTNMVTLKAIMNPNIKQDLLTYHNTVGQRNLKLGRPLPNFPSFL